MSNLICYRVVVQALAPSMRKHNTKTMPKVWAADILEACLIATEKHKNLGITPTTVSSVWALYPQSK